MVDDISDLSQGWNSLAAEMLDIYMPGGAPEAELAFYERRIKANGGAALDQACGTGRHLFPLLACGCEVHGADISADALDFVRQAALSTPKRFRQHLNSGGQLLLELAVPPEVPQGPGIHDADHAIRWEAEKRRGAEVVYGGRRPKNS
jgi:SAM-dependent methyltransferase